MRSLSAQHTEFWSDYKLCQAAFECSYSKNGTLRHCIDTCAPFKINNYVTYLHLSKSLTLIKGFVTTRRTVLDKVKYPVLSRELEFIKEGRRLSSYYELR